MTRGGALLLGLVLLLSGCTATDGSGERSSSPVAQSGPVRADDAPEARRPLPGQCYRLRFRDALAPTSERRPVACRLRHTSMTFAVGRLPRREGGRRLAVDSARVRERVADRCTTRLGPFLGADREELRLSMLTPVWFTPPPDAVGQGAGWFRCDVVVLGPSRSLVPLPRRLRGAYSDRDVVRRLAMCGTAAPGADGFRRVPCGRGHSWRAVRSVDLPGPTYPDADRVAALMEDPCSDAARAEADDALDLTWAQERPTRQRWRAGQRYGLCWVPAS